MKKITKKQLSILMTLSILMKMALSFGMQGNLRKCWIIIGGTMPEDLPTPKKSISQIEKEHMKKLKEKARKNKLILDE